MAYDPGSDSGSGESVATGGAESVEQFMDRDQTVLIERMDSESGLIEKLLKLRALTYPETLTIRGEKTILEKNQTLLQIIIKKKKHEDLLVALAETGQKHLVNFVRGLGKHRTEYDTYWPLQDKETEILDFNMEDLITDIEPTELINLLFKNNVINNMQLIRISSLPDQIAKNDALLSILRRGSLNSYQVTVSCLKETNQRHIAEILEHGGVLPEIHAELGGDEETVDETENEIVALMESMLQNCSLDQYMRIRQCLDLRIMKVKKGQSVVFYIYCKNANELECLREILLNDEFKKFLIRIWKQLLPHRSIVIDSIKWSDEKFNKSRSYFERPVVGKETEITKEAGVVDEEMQPVEERDEKVDKKKTDGVNPEPIEESEVGLPSNVRPYKGIDFAAATHGFAARHVSKIRYSEEIEFTAGFDVPPDVRKVGIHEETGIPEEYSREEITAAILRNNSDFLMEYIRPERLVDRLHASGCLKDEQTRYIKTLKYNTEKNYEILGALDEGKYSEFVECLRQTEQHLVADVIQNGGVVLKTKVSFEKSTPEMEKELVERINKLQLESGPEFEGAVRITTELRRGDIEIVGARYENGITLWIWCLSPNAQRNMYSMYNKGDLTKLLLAIFSKLLASKELGMIHVEIDDLDVEFVCPPPSDIQFQLTLSVDERSICGVTKSPGKIYVLCQRPSYILIFEDQNFSKHPKEINLREVEDPVDVVVCLRTDCLLVSDAGTSSVWKITEDSNEIVRWLINISPPYTLSLTKTGDVIMAMCGQPSSLDIYSSDGEMLRKMMLPSSIGLPNHAVETSRGTFILSYGEEAGKSCGISEMTADGNIIRYYNCRFDRIEDLSEEINTCLHQITEGRSEIGCPYHLTLDRHDQVYVADRERGGVLLFDKQLRMRQIVDRVKIQKTLQVYCDDNAEQLLVVNGEIPKLDVYRIGNKLR